MSRSSGPELQPRIDENQVGVIDPDHHGITAEYPVGRGATAMTAGGGSVWVANSRDATVSRIDRQHHEVSIPVDEDPAGVAFAAGSLWVTNRRDGTVSQINPATNRVVHEIPVGNAPHAIASGYGAVWVASEVDRTVTRIDLTRYAPMLPIDLGANPTAVATGAGAVWVASEEGGTVFRIEPRSGQVVKPIDVGNGPIGVVVADGAVWVANRQDGTVARIDPANDHVTDLVPVGRDPATIAAGKGAVWVGNAEGTVMRIDTGKRRVADTIRVANSPSAMVVADGSAWTAARAAPASHRGGTLRIEMFRPYVAPNLEPAAYQDAIYQLLSLAHDGLVAYRRTDGSTFGTLVGGLAVDVPDPSPDGKTYVFKLRRDIRYSDGAAVRPEDFRASLETFLRQYKRRAYLPRYYEHIVGAPVCMDHPASCDLSEGIVTDARTGTITIHLSEPDPDLLPRLAFPFAYVAPADHPFRPKEAPPSTGPYRIASFDPKRGARLVRNPYFRARLFDARPDGLADEIRVRIRGTFAAAVAAVESGDADSVVIAGAFGGPWSPKRIAALAVRTPGRLYTDAASETDWMFLNVRTPPFNDVRVRRALNYAVDRREVARRAGGADLAQLTCQLPPPGIPGYTPSCPYTANPDPGGGWSAPDMDLARRLIEQSGTKGQKVTVWGHSEKHAITQYFVSLLHRLGYRSTSHEFPHFSDLAGPASDSRSRAQIGINGWASDVAIADDFATQFRCAMFIPGTPKNGNPSGFCRHRIEDRIDEALAARGADADSIWQDVYRRLSNAAPAVPLVNRRTLTLVSKRVGNYQHHPLWGPLYDQMWVR
jgi:peptide/nickel transport system substrate-binding protein